MKVQLSFAVPPAEFDPSEFSSTSEVWHSPSGRVIGVKETGELVADTFTDGDANEWQLLELIHSTHFTDMKILERDADLR